ncbi:alpha-D-ribose 1-methylphosphonate 5-triphosphate diphosphatase [Natronorubrum aibiense]|uniref:Alpha-D-ribose 1-methylphosphonate 5-triphosphate diphosphatase n=1 Tax=Natronorubrum aibiense TaxID=348826 RepID=A0A5P9P9R2_9EURY|nr:alpha-D-ribose 1-methylphosphonate 5-triphosphate diphosphatase [Natronorubrum aibiense]QFU84842.1 alpha-D-ribose 1-methylphosphonate 5-triphosphate diphosphatase [Natronorubrum aibiense]
MSAIESGAEDRLEAGTIAIENARIVTPDTVIDGLVRVDDGRITAIGDDVETAGVDVTIDADGEYVLPGLIDVHGDDVERQLYPRSSARVETPMAFSAADRANLAAGVTTKFHAIAFEDSPEEHRSTDLATELTELLADSSSLLVDHRVHARCEITESDAVDAVSRVLEAGHADIASVMCHVPGKGQFRDADRFMEYYENQEELSIKDATRLRDERAAVDAETLEDRIERIVDQSTAADVVVASHDDENPTEVEGLAEQGISISEYPITLEAARAAVDEGLTVAMGAPNLVRGGSQWGNLGTREAIDADVVDILCADYHPPSLLAAPFVETGEPLPKRVARVTANPADAAGLTDRGRIEPAARADLVVVDPDPTPTVSHALVGGEYVYRARGEQ